jgi:hypothetical protein
MPKASGGGGSGGRSGGGGGGGSGATTKTLMIGGVAIKKGLTSSQLDDIWNASGASGGTPEYKAHMTKVASALKAAGVKAEDYEPETRARGKIERLYRRFG